MKKFAVLVSSFSHRDKLIILLDRFISLRHEKFCTLYVAFDGAIGDSEKNLTLRYPDVVFIMNYDNLGKVMNLKRALIHILEPTLTIIDEDDLPLENFFDLFCSADFLLKNIPDISSVSFYRDTFKYENLPAPKITHHYESCGKSYELHTLFIKDQLISALQRLDRKGYWPESIFLKKYSDLGGKDLRLPILVASGDYSSNGITKNIRTLEKKFKINMLYFYIQSLKSKDSVCTKIKRIYQIMRLFK